MQTWLGLTWVDWAVVSVYLIGVTILGTMAYRRVKNMSDFFMGGRRFGKVFMMFFAFGAGTSSEQAISVVAGTWRAGLAGIWWQFLWLWATPFYWLVAPILRRMRALTTSDFFEARFSTSTATLYCVYGMIMSIVFIAAGLYSSGKMVNALTGGQLDTVAEKLDIHVPKVAWIAQEHRIEVTDRLLSGYELAILAITVLFVTYGMAGGLGAAIITDFIQGILTITFSFLLLPWVLRQVGGFAGLHAHGDVKEGMFELIGRVDVAQILGTEPITIFYVVMLSVTALAGIVVQPHIMGVCGAGKTEFEGRFGFTYGNFIKRFCTVAWTFTGLACIVWYLTPELSPLSAEQRETLTPDRAVTAPPFGEEAADKVPFDSELDKDFADHLFGRAARDILPGIAPGLIGLLLASLLAAIMSTNDAQMVVSSGLFTENIYRRLLVRDRSQRHYLWVGRISGLVIVVFALVLQSTFTDVIDALQVIIKTPAAIGISLWVGVVWRGWTPAAVWVSTITAAATWALLAYFPHQVAAIEPLRFMISESSTRVSDAWTMFAYLTAGLVSGLAVSLVTPRPASEKLDRFFLLLRTPVRDGEQVDAPCTLPRDPLPPIDKLINHPDIEIPRPNRLDVGGFALAWLFVGLLIWFTYWLSGLGA